jgi:hypothetical protein
MYLPTRFYGWDGPVVKALEADVSYRAFYFDPISGGETDLGDVTPDSTGTWQAPMLPVCQDWVLVLESVAGE